MKLRTEEKFQVPGLGRGWQVEERRHSFRGQLPSAEGGRDCPGGVAWLPLGSHYPSPLWFPQLRAAWGLASVRCLLIAERMHGSEGRTELRKSMASHGQDLTADRRLCGAGGRLRLPTQDVCVGEAYRGR